MTQTPKAVMIFDGTCRFCRLWIGRWKEMLDERVEFIPAQESGTRFPQVSSADLKSAVHLVLPDGKVLSGAHAVFQSLALAPGNGWLLRLYQKVPGVKPLSELAYRFVAGHRNFFEPVTLRLWGDSLELPTYRWTRWLFLRAVAVVYLIAFASLSTQVIGLVGENGILPVRSFLESFHQQAGNDAYRFAPTLVWFNASDAFLQFLCSAGVVCSVLLAAGVLQKPMAIVLWIFYFSLYTAGQDFLSFQWDILLLETGFLAIFLAPMNFLPRPSAEKSPHPLYIWLVRLLLFRLIFQSGVVKLASGDSCWRDLTALTYHYETQCIPTPLAWYAHLLPLWFQKFSAAMMFGVELFIPFLIFTPRRLRFAGAWAIIGFQLLIALTGNYTFFNLLTIVLCISLFDDRALRRLVPRSLRVGLQPRVVTGTGGRILRVAFASAMLALNAIHLVRLFVPWDSIPQIVFTAVRDTAPFNVVNSYGLFRVMTKTRPEVEVQGSNDGTNWRPYEFKYKAGDVMRPPPWVAPHQPRLDWQMWFAALSDYQNNPWFVNCCVRLLQGSPDVLALLEKNPFPELPPRYIRALLYEYHFTSRDERRSTGAVWKRELKGIYLPVITLRRN